MTSLYNCLNGTCLNECSENVTCAHGCVLNLFHCSGLGVWPEGPASNGGNPVRDLSL
jgi:hypothetical protein